MATPCIKKAKTAFAEESGRIAVLTEREILTGTIWPLRRIPEGNYQTSLGHNPRGIRMQIAPPPRTEYGAILATGNEAKNFPNPLGGDDIAGYGDKQGRGCNIPAERIRWGYDEFGRCLRATALETDPMCLMDMVEKYSFREVIAKLRQKMPEFAREHFANELLRRVVQYSYTKYSVAEGMPTSTNSPNFPCIPTGGANIGVIRNVENLLRHYGWDKGSQTPVVNGRPALQVYMGRDSIDFAIKERKKQLGIQFQQSVTTVMDDTFKTTEVYEGIQFIENPMPPRGYVVKTGANSYEFREISPYVIRAGVEGIVVDPNPNYHRSFVTVGGVTYVVCELGYIIHPTAMERQAMGSVPTVDGKAVSRKFNFEVNMVPDWAIVPPECNKDGMWIQMRMLHAYAPYPHNPELMTAFLYIAATPQVIITNPNLPGSEVTPANQPVSTQGFLPAQADGCVTCADSADARAPIAPTCDTLFPADAVGVMRFAQLAYNPEESAGSVTLYIERANGKMGAASCVISLSEGTATNPENWTTPSGFAGTGPWTKTISWADGEFGIKTVVVPLVAAVGDDDGKAFNADLGTASGATIDTDRDNAVITISDADNA